MKNLFASLSLLLFAMLVPVNEALAIDGKIEQVDPPSARQGQTVMLTISGENLPQGSVVLDFFPQRIQLLKILSTGSDEIVAQVRIPSTAPAGSYNILIYNHLGEEAFGENMFTVDSDLVVPVISDYDPKVIAEADNGFALILTCDAITEPAVSHLNIEWSKGSLQLRRLETIFTYAGPDKIVAAISGALPEGSIRGRLKFDNTPIYLVELTIRASGAYVLGFSPTEIDPGTDKQIKLIGSGFTSSFLDGLSIQLLYDEAPILPREKRVLDANSISVVFGDELASGTYTLIVRQGEETLLLEDLLVKAGGILNQDTENNVVNQDDPPPAVSSAQVPPQWNSDNPAGSEGSGMQGNGDLISLEIGKMELLPGAEPARFTFISERLDELDADNLSYSLERRSGSSMLLFSGFTNNGITCIFGPDGGDWQAGEVLRLHVVDAANILRPFDQSLILEESGISAGLASEEQPTDLSMVSNDESWTVALTSHEESSGLTTGRIHLICTDDELPEVDSLSGSFSFTPADPGYQQFFSNLTLEGPLAISGSGANFQLEFSGVFVPGMLEIVISQTEEELLRANVDMDFSLPRALIDTSTIEGMNYDSLQRSLDRKTVECTVSFASLLPVSTEFLRPVLTPAPSVTTTDSELTFSGSSITATVPTGTWQSDTEFGAGLQLAFETGLQFDWVNGQSVLYPVITADAVDDSTSVSMPRRPVVIDSEGFILTIIPRGANTDQIDWTRVKLSSDNMLLNNNIDSFAVSMETVDFVGQPAVNLIFKRGRGLGQEAFDALAGQLEDSGEIAITLYWDEIRYSYQGMVSMVR